jgi:dinuclear metal center YbgI/SA1388 family protein
MAHRDEIVSHANELLDVARWPEFGPPGLQVIGADEVTTLVSGVSASRELFEEAAGAGAQMVLVHHGIFWRTEPLVVDRRLRGRLEALFAADMSLAAYHLALDAHPELGNAAQLAHRLGAEREGPFADVGVAAGYAVPLPLHELIARVEAETGRSPLVFAHGPDEVGRVAIVTGGGGYELIRAAREGFDVLVTGEPEEPSAATARELGITLVAAGHHATERLGVQALGAHLADRYGIRHAFVDVANPV